MFIATLFVCAISHVWVCRHVTYSISGHGFFINSDRCGNKYLFQGYKYISLIYFYGYSIVKTKVRWDYEQV